MISMEPENHPSSEPSADESQAPAPSPESPTAGYQPTTGRKLFMFLLCLVALIAVWATYWFASK
jgi:hypothetical protein